MTSAVGDLDIPNAVRALAGSLPIRPVWLNVLGGITFEVGVDPDRRFVKWLPPEHAHRLRREEERLSWLAGRATVPRVLLKGSDESGAWLLTAALPGVSAVAPRWLSEPEIAVRSIGEGLRALHDSLPVDACPFSWSDANRLRVVRERLETGAISSTELQPEFRCLDIGAILERLADPPPTDRLVVCHGDACAPNTLLDESGNWCGHVDFGSLGVADRWADIAVATWSTNWNYGPGWEDSLLAGYGIQPDPVRTEYYRLLWDLGP